MPRGWPNRMQLRMLNRVAGNQRRSRVPIVAATQRTGISDVLIFVLLLLSLAFPPFGLFCLIIWYFHSKNKDARRDCLNPTVLLSLWNSVRSGCPLLLLMRSQRSRSWWTPAEG